MCHALKKRQGLLSFFLFLLSPTVEANKFFEKQEIEYESNSNFNKIKSVGFKFI